MGLCRDGFGMHGLFLPLLHIGGGHLRPTATGHIFRAVDRADMRRIEAEIRSADAELLSVRIDPFPERFARIVSLIARTTIDAHDIGGQPVTVATAQAAAME